ncbi:MAG TPA: hypothetical protein PKD99_01710 [Sphingopyxis sp.]|nr:hypothetical protein [Sphingopyxis sp.]HMP43792.1 hypothetical protein [Sphingopyxis sp.]HMQ19831.1 hypothetical protein [Sphingopyxis sp.]
MHLTVVLLTMLVLPLASILIERRMHGSAELWELVCKWFLFWGAGVRLFLAGVRQIARPDLTATGMFGVTDERAFLFVQELGFWNLTIGLLCMVTLKRPDWRAPMGIAAMLFYALAGTKHALSAGRGFSADVAMISDLAMAALLLACLIATFGRWARA